MDRYGQSQTQPDSNNGRLRQNHKDKQYELPYILGYKSIKYKSKCTFWGKIVSKIDGSSISRTILILL